MDIAASIQSVTEEIVLNLGKHVLTETGEKNLCLAGGVALNCVANGVLVKEELFDDIWIQPAAGDAGGCLALLSPFGISTSTILEKQTQVTLCRGHFSGRHLKMKRLKMSCMPATQSLYFYQMKIIRISY